MYQMGSVGYYPASTPYYPPYGMVHGLPPQQYGMHPVPYQMQQQQMLYHDKHQRPYQPLPNQRQSWPSHQKANQTTSRISDQRPQLPGYSVPLKHVYVPPTKNPSTSADAGDKEEKQSDQSATSKDVKQSTIIVDNSTIIINDNNTKKKSSASANNVMSQKKGGRKDVESKSDQNGKNKMYNKDITSAESSSVSQNKISKKKSKKNKLKKSNDAGKSDKMQEVDKPSELSAADFPALDGKTSKTTLNTNEKNGQITGYAQALLKQPTAVVEPKKQEVVSTSTTTVEDSSLQTGMDKLAFT
jgi:hypothetical protein